MPSNGRFPLPNGISARVLRTSRSWPTWTPTTSPCSGADLDHVGGDRLRGQPRLGFIGDGPAANFNEPRSWVSAPSPEPAPALFSRFGWTQGLDFFSNTGKSRYNSLQAKLTKRFSGGYSLLTHYTLQSHKNNDGSYFFVDPDVNYGPANFIRTHVYVLAGTAELPIGRGKRYLTDVSRGVDAILGGWQLNASVSVMSGLPFNVEYRDRDADRDTGPGRPNLIGDPAAGSGDGLTSPYFNATPIGSPGSAFGRPARGTFGDLERNALRGPGFWNVDASLFKRFNLKASPTWSSEWRPRTSQPREPRKPQRGVVCPR